MLRLGSVDGFEYFYDAYIGIITCGKRASGNDYDIPNGNAMLFEVVSMSSTLDPGVLFCHVP